MHSQGVCHRDLKPDNIMYDPATVTIRIIDFGISKYFLGSREHGREPEDMWTVTGTLSFKAPEMLRGGGYSEKVDVWALGVIVYQMVTGLLPFEHEYQSEIIEAILRQDPDYSSIPDLLLVNLLKRMLKKNPDTRISAAETLNHPWFKGITSNEMSRSQRKKDGKRFYGHQSTTFDQDFKGTSNHDFGKGMSTGEKWLIEKDCLSESSEDGSPVKPRMTRAEEKERKRDD